MRPCRWPGCKMKVPPNLWGCKTHWYRLPQAIRNAIWHAYANGQEADLAKVSDEWRKADRAAREWAAEADGLEAAKPQGPQQAALPWGDEDEDDLNRHPLVGSEPR